MRWTKTILSRTALAAGTAAIVIVASGSTSTQASGQVKPADLPLCTDLGLPVVGDVVGTLCSVVETVLPSTPDLPVPEAPLPSLPVGDIPLPELTVPSLPLGDVLPIPGEGDPAPSTSAAPSLTDEIPAIITEIVVTKLPPEVIIAAAPLLPVIAPVQEAVSNLPLPASQLPLPSLRSVLPLEAIPSLTAPSLTIPPISVPAIPGLSDNGIVDVNLPAEICGVNVEVVNIPIGIGDCPTASTTATTAAPVTTAAPASETTVAAAAAPACIAPETTEAPAAPVTEAPTTSAVSNPSVPFRADNAGRQAVTNESVVEPSTTVAAPVTIAPESTTPATTADGCPAGNSGAGSPLGVQAAGGPTGDESGNGGSRGSGDNLPVTGLSLLALLVAGMATLSWGFVARQLAARKSVSRPA